MTRPPEDRENRWGDYVEAADTLLHVEQNVLGARDVLQEAIAFTEKAWGCDDVHLIRLFRLMAESFGMHLAPGSDHTQEVDYLRRALGVAHRRLPPDHDEICRLAGEVGVTLIGAGLVDEGRVSLEECVEIAKRNKSEERFSRYLSILASVILELQARPIDALPVCEHAARVTMARDPLAFTSAAALYQLGKCLFALERYLEATVQLERAVEVLDAKGERAKHARFMSDILELMDRARTATK